jgi:NADPH-dependent 2,4-dienoyl-CoA reductase/sulfur reductase-like enzyme
MKHAEVIVVGAGPTGIAAATQAARHGRSVLLVDDNPAAGGQIWRGGVEAPNQRANELESEMKSRALGELASSGAVLLTGYRVFDAPAPKILHALNESETVAEVVALQYDRLVIATGARERFLPFPGWTLPGVFGAGGLQALVKGGFPVGQAGCGCWFWTAAFGGICASRRLRSRGGVRCGAGSALAACRVRRFPFVSAGEDQARYRL